MKNIFIISAIYPPEPQISARMSFDLANSFIEEGHCVTVLCPQPSRLLGDTFDQKIDAKSSITTIENKVKVFRLSSFTAPASSLLTRMWESISFGREVTKYLANSVLKPDVLYVNSWPIFSQFLIARYAKKNYIPIVLQIMDIYPEALTNKFPSFLRFFIDAPFKMLDAWIAGISTTVVVISESMRRTYVESRHITPKSISTSCTWQDETLFENIDPRSACCIRYGIPVEPFTFLYLGNIGPVAGVDFLIRAFATANITDSQLLIVGHGSALLDCVNLVKKLNLSRVHFISDPDAANVPVLQGMAHVCLLPMKRGSGTSSIPSKLPSYLFSAKPVIATVDLDSDTADFVRRAECGWVGEPEDLMWLANKMKEVSRMSSEQLKFMGQQGKEFGLRHFSKSAGVVKLANTVLRAAGIKV